MAISLGGFISLDVKDDELPKLPAANTRDQATLRAAAMLKPLFARVATVPEHDLDPDPSGTR